MTCNQQQKREEKNARTNGGYPDQRGPWEEHGAGWRDSWEWPECCAWSAPTVCCGGPAQTQKVLDKEFTQWSLLHYSLGSVPQRFAVVVLHRHRKCWTRNSHNGASYTTAWAQCPNGLLWWSCTDTESVGQGIHTMEPLTLQPGLSAPTVCCGGPAQTQKVLDKEFTQWSLLHYSLGSVPQRFAVVVLHRHRKCWTRNSHNGASYTTAWAQCPNGLLWWSCTDTESVGQGIHTMEPLTLQPGLSAPTVCCGGPAQTQKVLDKEFTQWSLLHYSLGSVPQRFAVVVLHRHRKCWTRNSHNGASYTTAWAQCPNGLLWWSCTDTESVGQGIHTMEPLTLQPGLSAPTVCYGGPAQTQKVLDKEFTQWSLLHYSLGSVPQRFAMVVLHRHRKRQTKKFTQWSLLHHSLGSAGHGLGVGCYSYIHNPN